MVASPAVKKHCCKTPGFLQFLGVAVLFTSLLVVGIIAPYIGNSPSTKREEDGPGRSMDSIQLNQSTGGRNIGLLEDDMTWYDGM